MKLYTCTDHNCHYPVGVASIVLARDKRHAKRLLDKALIADGLKPYIQSDYTLTLINQEIAQAIILDNGDY